MSEQEIQALASAVRSYSLPRANSAYMNYMHSYHKNVKGWLLPPILSVVGVIADLHERAGFHGGHAEIGVHHGRFYYALATSREVPCVAIDVFGDQHLNPDGSGHGDLEQFLRHMSVLGLDPQRHTIIQSDSKKVKASNIIAAADGAILIFSVDGAHTVDYTMSDLSLAAETLHSCGIIIIDDIFNGRWPGVVEGTMQWMRQDSNDKYEMVAYGNNKGFIARSSVASIYRSLFAGTFGAVLSRSDDVVFAGKMSLFCRFSEPDVIFPLKLHDANSAEALSFAFSRNGNGLPCLGDGWSKAEAHGTWATSTTATISAKLPQSVALSKVEIQMIAYVPGGQSQRLRIFASDKEILSQELSNGSHVFICPVHDIKDRNNRSIHLKFISNKLFCPNEFSSSDDDRTLGIKLVSLSFIN